MSAIRSTGFYLGVLVATLAAVFVVPVAGLFASAPVLSAAEFLERIRSLVRKSILRNHL